MNKLDYVEKRKEKEMIELYYVIRKVLILLMIV